MLDELIKEARGWIHDCADGEVPRSISDTTVIRLVSKNYDGGWSAFVMADPGSDSGAVRVAMYERFGAKFAHAMYRVT